MSWTLPSTRVARSSVKDLCLEILLRARAECLRTVAAVPAKPASDRKALYPGNSKLHLERECRAGSLLECFLAFQLLKAQGTC